MAKQENVIKFENVDFEYREVEKVIFDEVNFNVRKGMKFTLMGQNGAGKSTLFKMITGELSPQGGKIHIDKKLSIAISKQVMDPKYKEGTVREFFEDQFDEKIYDIDKRIAEALEAVDFALPTYDKKINAYSGGQQARLLLASALIQNPDILLLDEPTNNLDSEGIGHLIGFLMTYEKTVIVISHDADFLNLFTDGVLYLDVHTHKITQYMGDYYTVVEEIEAARKKENLKNARLQKEIQAKREQANTFAHKGGKLRLVAKKMRDAADEAEDNMVDVRREDKTIKDFEIPMQADVGGLICKITELSLMKNHEVIQKKVDVELRKNEHLRLSGPNGIGKTTLLETLATKKVAGIEINPEVKIGYYRQDFSTLDFAKTVRETLLDSIDLNTFEGENVEEYMRKIASGFLIQQDIINSKIGSLSEGQKGLVAFCQLVLMKPGLLILDEPTNHINFRHIPVIAKALDNYKGAMILVSHVDEFVDQIRIDHYLDLGK
jgi:ATPase subunit of ABC transporter with duplicated ATPase domains